MSTIKVDTIATRTGSGNITLSNNVASLTSAGAISGTNITASGTLAVTGDATFDTSVLKVDAANNRVGIGTASPSSDLHVSGGAGAHVAIQSSAGSHWRLGDAVGSSNGIFVVRDHTNSANRIQILANGKTQIAQGMTFGSDTADANTLDDYEEGSWTPTIQSTTGVSKTASAYNLGRYTKVGNQVTLTGTVAWDGTENLAGGLIGVGGLPFASVALGNYRSAAAMGASQQVNQPTSYQNGLAMSMDQNSSVIWVTARSTSSYSHYPVIGNTGGIYGINITYRTA